MNRVELKGNVGLDPKTITAENGTKGVKFSVATTELIKIRDNDIKEEVTWHNVIAWGSKIKFIERIRKGIYIEITGKIRYNKYRGSDGIERYYTEIFAQNIVIPESQATLNENTDNQMNIEPKDNKDGANPLPKKGKRQLI